MLCLALALGLTILPAACSDDDSNSVALDKTLTVRNEGEIVSMDPGTNLGTTDEPAAELVYEGLVHYQPDSDKIVNQLAKTFEPSADGRRFDFTLKQGIPFHKGYGEVTAEDVKFSFERIAGLTDPPLKSNNRQFFDSLKEVQVKGKYSGTIILKRPDASFVPQTLATTLGAVYSKKAAEKLGNKRFASEPVGTGPYELTEWSPNQRYVFTRFAEYGSATDAKKPEWSKIVLLPITEDSAAQTGLQSGELDFAFIPIEAVDRFGEDSNFQLTKQIEFTAAWVGMNTRDPDLKDKRLREAIRYAIDVPAVIAAAYDNKWQRANSLIPSEMGVGYWKDAPKYDRDVEKARQLMRAAGHTKLDLTFHIYNGPQERNMAQVVQSNLAEIGINVKIIPQDSAAFGEVPGQGGGGSDRQLSAAWWGGGLDPSALTFYWTCDQVGTYNWVAWCDKEFNTLFDEARSEQDADKRSEMYVRMQELMDKSASTVWLAYPTRYYATRAGLKPSFRKGNRALLWNFRSN